MTGVEQEHKALDKALDDYINASNDVGAFVTGWFLVASLSSPGHDTGQADGYVSITSDGLPHHAQVGLLSVALDDKKNLTLMGTIRSMMYEDDDDEQEDA